MREASPPAREGLVVRDRLARCLPVVGEARIVLLAAPAGYGKTVLLEEWARRDGRPFCRLTAGRDLAAQLRRAAARPAVTGPVVFALDDLDVPDGTLGDLTGLTGALPAGAVLALATRRPDRFATGRLRARRELLVLGQDVLALTRSETLAVLERAGLQLPPARVQSLVTAIDGWPAAASLVAQALRDAPPAAASAADAAAFAARVVDGYVHDEVLGGLPAGARAMLRHGAVLEPLGTTTCRAVLDDAGAQALSDLLDREALPLGRSAATGPHCHDLVRRVLLADLRRTEPAREPRLHRRARSWLAARGDLDGALGHALSEGDAGAAAALLWPAAAVDAWSARRGRLCRCLDRARDAPGAPAPALAVAAAVDDLARLSGDRLGHDVALAGDAPLPPSPAAMRAVLRAVAGDVAVPSLREAAARAGAATTAEDPARAACRLLEGVGAALAGDPAAAVVLQDGRRRAAVLAPGLAALCEAQLALIELAAGDAGHGRALAERARARVAAEGLEGLESMALVLAVAGLAHAQTGRYAQAAADVTAATALMATATPPAWYAAQVDLAAGRARLRFGAVAAAHVQLTRADRAARRLAGAEALRGWTASAVAGVGDVAHGALAGAEALTVAELRVLRLLPTHLSFREIGERFAISGHTVKSQAHAVYRKLGARSRSQAVERAAAYGLLDPDALPSALTLV